MFPFERLVAMVLIVLLVVAAMILFIFSGSSGSLQTFASARSICESSYAGSCYNTGKAPVTWDTPTQNLNGSALSCSQMLNCTCMGPGKNGRYFCSLL